MKLLIPEAPTAEWTAQQVVNAFLDPSIAYDFSWRTFLPTAGMKLSLFAGLGSSETV
jgi:hypothetical protein